MVTRKLLTAMTVGLSVGLLAQHATGAEPQAEQKAPPAGELVVDAELFRNDIDSYVRELNRQMHQALNEDLRRQLAPKVEIAVDELRTKG